MILEVICIHLWRFTTDFLTVVYEINQPLEWKPWITGAVTRCFRLAF